mmetsp:Transcript_17603/g.19806  ORF Transcript_17603/g.19806 Transcript_17603/m.19806 type:complete len:157 (+) Transcript_17603:39-509(+)
METTGKLKVILGCDHAGFDYKEKISNFVTELGHEIEDVGCFTCDSVDYPEFAQKVAETVVEDPETRRGILVCGTGIGVSIAANKVKGAICGLCHDHYTAQMCREHNNANIIAMGSRTTGIEVCKEMIETFLSTDFKSEHPNHPRRVAMLKKLDEKE